MTQYSAQASQQLQWCFQCKQNGEEKQPALRFGHIVGENIGIATKGRNKHTAFTSDCVKQFPGGSSGTLWANSRVSYPEKLRDAAKGSVNLSMLASKHSASSDLGSYNQPDKTKRNQELPRGFSHTS